MGQNPPALWVKFGSDPKQLAFFLTQVWTYMQEYGGYLPIEGTKVWCVTLALETAAVGLMVALHNKDAPELHNWFMVALYKRFKDPLADQKAKIHMKTINHGEKSMAA